MSTMRACLKVDTGREISSMVMTSYYESVRLCSSLSRVFVFGDLLCSFLASRLTTVSLDL